MNWRIYYGDGSTYSDEDGSAFDAPGLNVQAICCKDPECGRQILTMHDFYWWSEGAWFGGDVFGLWDYLQSPGQATVKFGRSLSRSDYKKVYQRAATDPDFPSKSAKSREELL